MTVSIERIFSRVRPTTLLHLLIRPCDTSSNDFNRINVCSAEDRLQLAVLDMPLGQTFVPHIHVESDHLLPRQRAQESWVIMRGAVLFSYFDIDGSRIGQVELQEGDASVTLAGGHTYEALEAGTLVYEFKTGPYLGQELDKAPIVDGEVELLPGQRTLLSR
jgi:hypothetical protein